MSDSANSSIERQLRSTKVIGLKAKESTKRQLHMSGTGNKENLRSKKREQAAGSSIIDRVSKNDPSESRICKEMSLSQPSQISKGQKNAIHSVQTARETSFGRSFESPTENSLIQYQISDNNVVSSRSESNIDESIDASGLQKMTHSKSFDPPSTSPSKNISYSNCSEDVNDYFEGKFTSTRIDDDDINSTSEGRSTPLRFDQNKSVAFGEFAVIPIYESSKSIEEIDEEIDVNKNQGTPARRRKPPEFKDWMYICTFDNVDEAKAALQAEKLWSVHYKKNNGTKVFYRCNKAKLRGRQCASAVYHLFKDDSGTVLEFRTNAPHDHDEIVDKLTIEKKNALVQEVETLIDLGVKPMNIMHALKKKGFELPARTQLTTIIAAIRKRKFGPATISLGDLSKWLVENSHVPEDMHKAFVLCHEVNMDDTEPYFRFMITTKHLLSQTKLRVSHADTTYKCIWQGFPVFMVGTSDWAKAYHPYSLCVCTNEQEEDFRFVFDGLKNGTKRILGFEMEQSTIVCDAAAAISNAFLATFGDNALIIMCWFHVMEAVEQQLPLITKEKNRVEILSDIGYLHIAASASIFNNAVKLFLLKWIPKEPDFCEYFHKIWIKQHPNRFIGAADYIPCHNNALESSNRYLKESHTFRIRFPLPQFLKVAIETVEKWSNNYIIGLKKFALQPNISLPLWTNSYNWARSNIPTKVVTCNEDTIIVEIEAEVVRAKQSSKRAVVHTVSPSYPLKLNTENINKDLQQLFQSEKAEGKRATKRRVIPNKASGSESPPTTVKRRRVATKISKSQSEAKKAVTRRPVVSKSKSETSENTDTNVLKCESSNGNVLQSSRMVEAVVSKSQSATSKKTATKVLKTHSSSDTIQSSQIVEVSEASSHEVLEDFETYKRSFHKWKTTIVKENVLYASRCNCPAFGTEYICKHIVGLGIRMKLVTPPPEAKTVPIGQKRKRGRPAKTKPALMLQ